MRLVPTPRDSFCKVTTAHLLINFSPLLNSTIYRKPCSTGQGSSCLLWLQIPGLCSSPALSVNLNQGTDREKT